MQVKITISRERDEEINEIMSDFGDSIRLRTWVKFRMRDNNWSNWSVLKSASTVKRAMLGWKKGKNKNENQLF